MGTRSLVHIQNEQRETLVTLYRQFDGYPTGMGKDIKDALNQGNVQLRNGFGDADQVPAQFNGMGCLAAYLVGQLKEHIGNVYIRVANDKDLWEEYVYTLFPIDTTPNSTLWIKIQNPSTVIYEGRLSEFDPERVESEEQE